MKLNHDLQRFEAAEQSRAALRIAHQPAPSNKVRVMRYRDGQCIEIIEGEPEQARRAIEVSRKREAAAKRASVQRKPRSVPHDNALEVSLEHPGALSNLPHDA